jgi:uncharacterized membrane protein YkvA (DUF1232 family)
VPIDITFQLSDQEISKFAAMAKDAREAIDPVADAENIMEASKALLQRVKSSGAPEFIENRINRLESLIEMISDEEWGLPEEDIQRVTIAMAYFAQSDDLIPDDVPVIGFLDDAIMVELVFKELQAEVMSYLEFCAFRSMEERRLVEAGQSTEIDREKWLAGKRTELHAQMRERRQAPLAGSAWRVTR